MRAADGVPDGPVAVRLGGGRWLRLGSQADLERFSTVSGGKTLKISSGRGALVLPEAAARVLPDLLLLEAGLIELSQLHPLVAEALAPDDRVTGPAPDRRLTGLTPDDRLTGLASSHQLTGPAAGHQLTGPVSGHRLTGPAPAAADRLTQPASDARHTWQASDARLGGSLPAGDRGLPSGTRVVDCHGVRHRIGLVDGVLSPLDHDQAEIRREQLLVDLGGTPMPCMQAIDMAIRHPADLVDVRARLDHGDYAGALDVLEALLGPKARLRDGALQRELEAAADQQVTRGLFRTGMAGHCPPRSPAETERRRQVRTRPRQASAR
jgi:hypothetical protein